MCARASEGGGPKLSSPFFRIFLYLSHVKLCAHRIVIRQINAAVLVVPDGHRLRGVLEGLGHVDIVDLADGLMSISVAVEGHRNVAGQVIQGRSGRGIGR